LQQVRFVLVEEASERLVQAAELVLRDKSKVSALAAALLPELSNLATWTLSSSKIAALVGALRSVFPM
jgi:hypothetical protein